MLSACALLGAWPAAAQQAERTIEEIKVESQARAERNAYPLIGMNPADVREVLGKIQTRDKDEWAAAWSAKADQYYQLAEKGADPAERVRNYLTAWRIFYFAQWPTPGSPGKQRAYDRSIEAYLKAARLRDPSLEVVKVAYEGKTLTGYLRLPAKRTGKVPLIIVLSGLDSRKENMLENYWAIPDKGVAVFVADTPGTGQSAVKGSPTAERPFSKAIDYLVARPEIDAKRILLHGVSFGGYWASKLAIVEHDRLLGVVAQSPAVDRFFSAEFQRSSIGNREYLFDMGPAYMAAIDGANSLEDLFRLMPAMSLAKLGLLDKPSAPMLVLGGAKDSQIPVSEFDLLMRSGDVPKEGWLNPRGAHLGRDAFGWNDGSILQKIILPWEMRKLGIE